MLVEASYTHEFQGIPPTGKQFTVEIHEIVCIADARIAERWVALKPNVAELVQQLRSRM